MPTMINLPGLDGSSSGDVFHDQRLTTLSAQEEEPLYEQKVRGSQADRTLSNSTRIKSSPTEPGLLPNTTHRRVWKVRTFLAELAAAGGLLRCKAVVRLQADSAAGLAKGSPPSSSDGGGGGGWLHVEGVETSFR